MPRLTNIKISKDSVDDLPTDRDAVYFDSELKGFGVRTKKTGSKIYLVQYRSKEGRSGRVSLGSCAVLTPKEARDKARQLLAEVANGFDPARNITEARKAMTVADLCADYLVAMNSDQVLGKKRLPKKASTRATDAGRITHHILPKLGKRRVRDLTRADIVHFMDEVTVKAAPAKGVVAKPHGRVIVKGGAGTAARTVGLLSGILAFAVDRGIISQNPAHGIKKPVGTPRKVRLEAAHYEALGKALKAAEWAGEPWQPIKAIALLALTGCRLGEITNLKWSEVDLTGQALRLSDSKTGASIRPIGSEAVDLLSKLDQVGPYVFPATRLEKAPYGGLRKAWLRVIAREARTEVPLLTGLTPHGLRHAFASVAGDLGLTELTIGTLLGHASSSVTSRYVHSLDRLLIGAADQVCHQIASQMKVQPTQ